MKDSIKREQRQAGLHFAERENSRATLKRKLFLLFALLCAVAQGAWAQFTEPIVYDDVWDGSTTSKPEYYENYKGKDHVFVIKKASELAWIRDNWEEDAGHDIYTSSSDYCAQDYFLDANINMRDDVSWVPMGNKGNHDFRRFKGKFYGNYHTICFNIGATDTNFQGLFAFLDGTVQDLHVTGTIACGDARNVGAIAGGAEDATIRNCWVSSDVSSNWREPSSAYDAAVGGIVGNVSPDDSKAFIEYCCVTGNVTNNDAGVGGLVGYKGQSAYIKHCTFYGTRSSTHDQHSIYIGDEHFLTNADDVTDLHDTFNQAEYDDAVSKGYNLYAYAIKDNYKVTVTTTGDGTVETVDIDADVTDLTKVKVGHWVRVNVTSGVVSSFSVKDADNNDVSFAWNHLYGDNHYIFVMPKSDVSVTVNFTTQQGDGTEANPYRIANAADWEAFVKTVNDDRKSYEGEFVMLDGDFEVSTYQRVGTGAGFMTAFKGTFDGNGHTLTCIYAPFHQVMDATIKNLHVIGNATGYHSSGSIVDYSKGALKLINCRSSVNVNCIDQFYGGLVGIMSTSEYDAQSPNPNSITIEGCVFDGSFYSTNAPEYKVTNCSGFVGDAKEGGNVTIRNSFLKPASVGEDMLANTFAYMRNGSLTIENSYFVAADNLPTNQGTQAHTITAGDDVTISNLGAATTTYGSTGITVYAKGVKYDGVYYAGSGENVTLTLSHDDKESYLFKGYTLTAGTLSGSTLTMPAADVIINADWRAFLLTGTGTASDPYIISTDGQWDDFASAVNEGFTFSEQFFKLNSNISVSTMAGASDTKSFQGTFDGDGKTLTFTKGTSESPFSENFCAPFRHVKNATIKKLHVAGTITTSAQFAAGFVGESHGALNLAGCCSSVAINSSVSGDGTHGGLVSTLSGADNEVIIDGCVFDGSFATTANTTNCGGFVGWPVYNRPIITNSLMKPSSVDAGMLNNTFARWHTTYKPTITNCYYVATDNLPTDQGMEPVIFNSAPEGLSDIMKDYSLVKTFTNGILYDGTYYVNGRQVFMGAGTADNPYKIYYKEQLDLLANRVNGTNYMARRTDGYVGVYFKLMNDIEYSYEKAWNDATSTENNYTAIGHHEENAYYLFCGDFDGDGHTISGIRIYKGDREYPSSCQGLFGDVGEGANIHDIILADASITGHCEVGGIVGRSKGTITGCHVAATVAIHAKVYGCYYHGGIVGLNYGTVSHCTSAATLTYSYQGNTSDFGGISGCNTKGGTLSDNLAIGTVVPALTGNFYGAISGSNSGTLQRNYYTACTMGGTASATGVGCKNADKTDNDGAVPALRDRADNTTAIALMSARNTALTAVERTTPLSTAVNIVLNGRTLYKDGAWNTICLPFNVTLAGSPLAGAVARPLESASISGSTLNLTFGDAVTTLTAGTPYIIKWTADANYVDDDEHNLVSPVFTGVTIDDTDRSYDTDKTSPAVNTDERVRFLGTYKSTSFNATDNTVLLLGNGNKLYYPTTGAGLGAQRAYFKLGSGEALARQLTAFNIDFGDESTGIISISKESGSQGASTGWYTLDGRRLDGKPTTKGIYVNNGKKVIIK